MAKKPKTGNSSGSKIPAKTPRLSTIREIKNPGDLIKKKK
jgi:hypothetical protein